MGNIMLLRRNKMNEKYKELHKEIETMLGHLMFGYDINEIQQELIECWYESNYKPEVNEIVDSEIGKAIKENALNKIKEEEFLYEGKYRSNF